MQWRASTIGQRFAVRLVAFALRRGATEAQLRAALGTSHTYRDEAWREGILSDAKFRNVIRRVR